MTIRRCRLPMPALFVCLNVLPTVACLRLTPILKTTDATVTSSFHRLSRTNFYKCHAKAGSLLASWRSNMLRGSIHVLLQSWWNRTPISVLAEPSERATSEKSNRSCLRTVKIVALNMRKLEGLSRLACGSICRRPSPGACLGPCAATACPSVLNASPKRVRRSF